MKDEHTVGQGGRMGASIRGKWFAQGLASGGVLSIAAAGTANAVVTQISLVGNYLVDNDPSNFDRDLTGDGNDDLFTLVGGLVNYSRTSGYQVRLNFGTQGYATAKNEAGFTDRARIRNLYSGGVVDSVRFYAPTSQTLGLPIWFTDANINGGVRTRGLLELTAATSADNLNLVPPGSAGIYRITLNRLIFELGDPSGGDLPGPINIPGFDEFDDGGGGGGGGGGGFGGVPEPSRVALLALGAAGVLARRQRPRRQQEAVAE